MLFNTGTILSLMISYRYFLILPIAIIEGPIVTVIAAFLASQGYFNIFLVYLIVVLGDIIGDLIYYFIGKLGKNHKLLNRLELNGRMGEVKIYLKENPGKTLLFGKLTHSAGFIILIGAGAANVPMKKFLLYNLIGTSVKSLVFLLVGYFTGSAYVLIDSYLGKIFLLLFVFVFCIFMFKFIFNRNKND